MIGKGLASVFKRMKLEEKYLLTCGAAAGLSAAFNAPLAGVLFALEEIHKNFSPLALWLLHLQEILLVKIFLG